MRKRKQRAMTFIKRTIEKYGFRVFRPKWPDFFVCDFTSTRYCFVRIKEKSNQHLSEDQKKAFSVFKKLGISVCVVDMSKLNWDVAEILNTTMKTERSRVTHRIRELPAYQVHGHHVLLRKGGDDYPHPVGNLDWQIWGAFGECIAKRYFEGNDYYVEYTNWGNPEGDLRILPKVQVDKAIAEVLEKHGKIIEVKTSPNDFELGKLKKSERQKLILRVKLLFDEPEISGIVSEEDADKIHAMFTVDRST